MAKKIQKIKFDPKKGLEEVKVQLSSDNGDDLDVTMNLSMTGGGNNDLQEQLLTKIFEKEVENIKDHQLQPKGVEYPKKEYLPEDFPPLTGLLLKHGFEVVGVKYYVQPTTSLVAKNTIVIIGKGAFQFEKLINIKFNRTYVEKMFEDFGPEHISIDEDTISASPSELSYGIHSVWNIAQEYKNIIEIEEYTARKDHYTKNPDVKMKVVVKDSLQKYVVGKGQKTLKFLTEEFAFSDVELAIEKVAPITSIRSLTPAPKDDTAKFLLDTTPFKSVGFSVGAPISVNPNSPGSFDKDAREVMIKLPIAIYDYETEMEMIADFELSYYEDLLKNFSPRDVKLTNLAKFISTDDPEFTEAMLAGNLETDKEVELNISVNSLVRDLVDKRKFGFTVELTAGTFNSLLDVEGNLGLGINPPKKLIAEFTDFNANSAERLGGVQMAEALASTGVKDNSVSSIQLDTREIEIREI